MLRGNATDAKGPGVAGATLNCALTPVPDATPRRGDEEKLVLGVHRRGPDPPPDNEDIMGRH